MLRAPWFFALLGLTVACRRESAPSTEKASGAEAATVAVPPELVREANTRISARQDAVKRWKSLALPASAAPCTVAPPPPKLNVNGFRTGTTEAEKTMSILTAAEVEGLPDPSLPEGIARDLATVAAAGRGLGKLGWAEIDYTSNDYPFGSGPIAKRFQYALRKTTLDKRPVDTKELLALLTGRELILLITGQVRPVVNSKAHTYTVGTMSGTALLWSYDDGAIVCAGRFDAGNETETFTASAGQAQGLPKEELALLAYRNAATTLQALPPAAPAPSASK